MAILERLANWLKTPAPEDNPLLLPVLETDLVDSIIKKVAKARQQAGQTERFGTGVFRFETKRFGGGREYLTLSNKILNEHSEIVLTLERPLDPPSGVISYKIIYLSNRWPDYFQKQDEGFYRDFYLEIIYGEWTPVENEEDKISIVKDFLDTLTRAFPQRNPQQKERMFRLEE